MVVIYIVIGALVLAGVAGLLVSKDYSRKVQDVYFYEGAPHSKEAMEMLLYSVKFQYLAWGAAGMGLLILLMLYSGAVHCG